MRTWSFLVEKEKKFKEEKTNHIYHKAQTWGQRIDSKTRQTSIFCKPECSDRAVGRGHTQAASQEEKKWPFCRAVTWKSRWVIVLGHFWRYVV